MSVRPAIGDLSPMNALNWANSTGVSLLSGPGLQFKMNEFNSRPMAGDRRSGLAEPDRSVARSAAVNASKFQPQNRPNQQNEQNQPATDRSGICSTCGMLKPLVVQFATKGKHCARCLTDAPAARLQTGKMKNGQPMNGQPMNGQPMNSQPNNGQANGQSRNGEPEKSRIDRIEKPKKKRRKSKKLIKQQSNQIQQQSPHIIQRNPSAVLASAMNEISSNHSETVVGKQEKASKLDKAGRPDETARPTANRETLIKIRSNPIEVVKLSEELKDAQTKLETKVQNRFSWKKYLKDTNSLAAPLKCFKPNQTFNNKPNYFKPGMRLEAIDPNHPSLFCVASVVEVCGFRMRIHLDQYSSQFDFWVNCDSPFIFPVGFCASTGRQLQSPKNQTPFDWSTYLHRKKAKAAPRHCFYWYNRSTETPAGFRAGMKLEAVDKSNVSAFSVGVATIADLLGEWLLIHFDGWPAVYDYWTRCDSPDLHPINWCKKQKCVQLTPPPNDRHGTAFDWELYLKATESSAVISNLFKCRSQNSFKPKMKVEAVDPRNPRYVRVATVAHRAPFAVQMHFDHFDSRFDVWLSDSSPDLHPIGWCLQANIPLEPPPATSEFGSSTVSSSCPTPTCNGIGHLRDPNALEHRRAVDCPYALENADYELPDRLAVGQAVNGDRSDTSSLLANRHSTGAMDASDSSNDRHSSSGSSPSGAESSPLLVSSDSVNCETADLVKELNSFVNTLSPVEVLNWNAEKVSDLVSILPRCIDLAQRFLDERLDGQSFLLLTHSDLVNILGIQRYQAFMIYSTICQIRRNLIQTT